MSEVTNEELVLSIEELAETIKELVRILLIEDKERNFDPSFKGRLEAIYRKASKAKDRVRVI